MKALKASICAVVAALALSLSLGAPSCAAEDEASTLSQQMKELYRAGKYTEALPLAQKSLALREKEFGPDDANVAMPLNDLARSTTIWVNTPLPNCCTSAPWLSGKGRSVRIMRKSLPC
jgi:tetratricopeptide repeat protein